MKKYSIYILVIGLMLFQYACKKNDAGDGPPVITKVRSVDTTKRDSFFVQAIPGNLIVIQGTNLQGLKAVFFNDTAAYFNPSYATSTNIILTIPATAQTAATDPKVPSVIKLVTDHGEVSYPFTLYLPPPAISSITFDNSGTLVYINGYNFQGVNKITFPVPGAADTALSYIVNKTFTTITAVIPPGTALQDSLRVFCTFGSAAFSYPPPMTVTAVSNENAIGGSTITFKGSNFVRINKVTFPGGLLGTNITPVSVSEFSVDVPNGVTTSDSIHIQGALGSATAPQPFATNIGHLSPGYLTTFENQYASDNTAFVGWTGGYNDAPTTTANFPGGTGASGLLWQQSPMAAASNATTQGNSGLMQLSDFPWVANTNELVKNYSLKFEVSSPTPWTKGAIWIAVGDWYGWNTYMARYAPWSDAGANGTFQTNGWVTVTIPLTNLISGMTFSSTAWSTAGSPATKFSDYATTGLAFLITNDDPKNAVPANSVKIAIDNVRIVKGQ